MWYISIYQYIYTYLQRKSNSSTKKHNQMYTCSRKGRTKVNQASFPWRRKKSSVQGGFFLLARNIFHIRNIIKNRDKQLNGSVWNLCFKWFFCFFFRLWFCLLYSLDGSICESVYVCVCVSVGISMWIYGYVCVSVCLFIHCLWFCSFSTYVIFGCFSIYEFKICTLFINFQINAEI